MKRLEKTLVIPRMLYETIENYLNATNEGEFQGEDSTISFTAEFEDGIEMDIKCCGSDDGASWTEAVLVAPSGGQIAYTDVSDDILGEWELEDEETETVYVVNVLVEK